MATHNSTTLTRWADLRNVSWNSTVDESFGQQSAAPDRGSSLESGCSDMLTNTQPIQTSPDKEHRDRHRTCLDGRGHNTQHRNDLYASLASKKIQQPEYSPAANAACSCVDTVRSADDTATIARLRRKVEMRVERRSSYDYQYLLCHQDRDWSYNPITLPIMAELKPYVNDPSATKKATAKLYCRKRNEWSAMPLQTRNDLIPISAYFVRLRS